MKNATFRGYDDDNLAYYLDLTVVSDRVRGSAVGSTLADYKDLEVIGNIYENPELISETSC